MTGGNGLMMWDDSSNELMMWIDRCKRLILLNDKQDGIEFENVGA